MDSTQITFTIQPDERAEEELIERLKAFNDAGHPLIALRRQNPDDPKPIQALARDPQGNVIGGILAKVWLTWKWLQIDIVWVDEPFRNQNLGTRLLDEIERQAVELGCTRAKVSSWSFQAPGFYQKRGYVVYGELQNFPEGTTDYQLWKSL